MKGTPNLAKGEPEGRSAIRQGKNLYEPLLVRQTIIQAGTLVNRKAPKSGRAAKYVDLSLRERKHCVTE
jgi:hypothetical protein